MEKNSSELKNHKKWIIVIIFLTIFMIGLSFSGKFLFYSWPQVNDIYNYNLPFMDLYDHPHFLRYLVAYPGLYLADFYGEEFFSAYIVMFMSLSIYLMYYLLRDAKSILILCGCLSVFVLHLFMNGRGAISWLGWMLIIYTTFSNKFETQTFSNFFIITLALLLCSVSSGTFSVAFVAVIIFYIHRFFKEMRFFNTKAAFANTAMMFILYFYYDIFISGIYKNMNYYSGGDINVFYRMLEHGAGSILIDYPIYIILLSVFSIILFTYILFSLERMLDIRELIIVVIPLFGGVFGYTTMTLAIPSIFLVVYARIGGIDLLGQENQSSGKAIRI